jgi:hypothetical protein
LACASAGAFAGFAIPGAWAASPIITGTDEGAATHVKSFDGQSQAIQASFFAYSPDFTGGVRLATGDLTGDGRADLVTAAGPNSPGGHVKVIDGTRLGQTGADGTIADSALVASFLAYGSNFNGGVYVAAGDVNADRRPDVITGTGAAASQVKVIDGTRLGQTGANGTIADSALLASFLAYSPNFTGGVRVATGDVNGDGRADVITGAGPGGDHVKVIDGTRVGQIGADGVIADSAVLADFFAYGGYQGGVFVAAGDVTGDGRADVITGTDGTASGGHVKAFDAVTGAEVRSFLAYGAGFTGGVRVAAGDINGDNIADIITGAGAGGGGHVKAFDGVTGAQLQSFLAYNATYTGGTFVAGETPAVPEAGAGALLSALGAALLAARRSRRGADHQAATGQV